MDGLGNMVEFLGSSKGSLKFKIIPINQLVIFFSIRVQLWEWAVEVGSGTGVALTED